VREPLVQTQVLPYLRELKKDAYTTETPRRREASTSPSAEAAATPPKPGGELKVSLLTFEPDREGKDLAEFEKVRVDLASEGIEWDWLPYHKRPSAIATAWDIFRGAVYIWRRIGRFDVLHGRVHVPTLMAALARKFSLKRPKILFDIRGFFPEEYTDAGIWPENGLLYRGAKRVERWLMKEADAFVVLTERAREVLFPESMETGFDNAGGPVEVIPCCVDFERRFSGDHDALRAEYRTRLGIDCRYVIVHLGALGGLYLVNEIADLLAAARKRNPAAFALFLTQSDPRLIEPLLAERGFSTSDYFIGRVAPNDVEGYLHASDIGLSIVKASFATLSRSPTKIPEYLACGLPIIANAGVGDVDQLIERNGLGALIEQFDPAAYSGAIDEIEELGDVSQYCRDVAFREFDLENVGGVRYRSLYSLLLR